MMIKIRKILSWRYFMWSCPCDKSTKYFFYHEHIFDFWFSECKFCFPIDLFSPTLRRPMMVWRMMRNLKCIVHSIPLIFIIIFNIISKLVSKSFYMNYEVLLFFTLFSALMTRATSYIISSRHNSLSWELHYFARFVTQIPGTVQFPHLKQFNVNYH